MRLRTLAPFALVLILTLLPQVGDAQSLTIDPPAPQPGDDVVVTATGVNVLRLEYEQPFNQLLQFIALPVVAPESPFAGANPPVQVTITNMLAGLQRIQLLTQSAPGVPVPLLFAPDLLATLDVLVGSETGRLAVDVAPAAPTTDDILMLSLLGCADAYTFEGVDDRVIRLGANDRLCVELAPQIITVDPLPAGDYTIVVEDQVGPTRGRVILRQPVTVAASGAGPIRLRDGRFELSAGFRLTPSGPSRLMPGAALADTDETAALWFFERENKEVFVKVLDGCANNGHYWVFLSGLTNVAVDLTVRDTASGATRSYSNPLGQPFQPRLDTSAFATCP
ncbi:MAG: hypothetical protein AAF772_12275 [Acidobacteriota bacterium]